LANIASSAPATPFELCEHVEKIIRKMEYVCSAAVTTTFDQGVPAYAINFHTRVASYYCIVAPHDLESASDAEIVAMILKAKA